MKRKLSVFAILVICVLLCMAISACNTAPGNSPATAPPATGNATTPTAPPSGSTEAPAPIKIGNLSMGTANSGGTYYIIGAGLASIWNNVLDANVTAEVTAGATENIRLMNANEMQIGIISAEDADLAVRGGNERYPESYEIMAVLPLYPNVLQPIVLENSSIRSLNDVIGKKVAVGAAGGGVYTMNQLMLNVLGIDIKNDITPYEIGFGDAATSMKDGTIDCSWQTTGAPNSAFLELEATNAIRLLAPNAEELRTLLNLDYYYEVTIPAGTYASMKEDIQTVGSWCLLSCMADADEEVVYQLIKSIFENLNQVHEIHAAANYIQSENLIYADIEYHPGAIRYFEEQGWTYLK